MKSKLWVMILVVLTAGFSTAADCGCVSGECGSSAARPESSSRPACHHEEAESKPASHQGCCGKCQIEKTAVLGPSATHTLSPQPKPSHVPAEAIAGPSAPTVRVAATAAFLFEAPPGFFTDHILGTSLALRAPPPSSLPFFEF